MLPRTSSSAATFKKEQEAVRRPIALAIVAAFLWVATGIAVIVGISLLFPGTPLDRMWVLNRPAYAAFQSMGRLSGIFLLLLGSVTAAGARGLLQRRRWAWWLVIGIFVVNGIGDLVGLFVTRDVIRSGSGALVAAAFLSCLMTHEVRRYFQ